MTVSANRVSTYTTGSGGSDGRNGEPKNLWRSMLESVASGKKLPEKSLLVLGGGPETQREFLESLSNSELRRNLDRQTAKIPPVANNFALGYTYYDVLDADQEDILARVSLYLLSTPSPSFTSLVKPLLTPETIPNTLIVILLDWSQPNLWLRQLQEWISMIRVILQSLDMTCMDAMEEVMVSWRDRGRGGGSTNLDGTGTTTTVEGDSTLPLGPGEWDDGIGLPLCVVCQNTGKMELLEKSQGWKEADFDQILQYLRTILLRHGASLIYTTPNMPSSLPSLIHSSLGITSLLKRQPLKPNTIDRDKILVPPNWDSWGKIRVLRDGFDVEAVSNGWGEDIHRPWPAETPSAFSLAVESEPSGSSALRLYEDWIPDASTGGFHIPGPDTDVSDLEVEVMETQEFLKDQSRYIEALRRATDSTAVENMSARGSRRTDDSDVSVRPYHDLDVRDHIGPVQFNMGGIQVDADDMLQRLKDRQTFGATPDPTTPPNERDTTDAGAPDMDNDKLQAFFSGLMLRKGGGSVTNSPRAGAS